MASREVDTLEGEKARLWFARSKGGKVKVSQRRPNALLACPGYISPFFCVGFRLAGKPGMLDALLKTLGGHERDGHVVFVIGIYNIQRTFPEEFVCYMHNQVPLSIFNLSTTTYQRYSDLIEAGMQPSLLRSIMMNGLDRKAFWEALQAKMDSASDTAIQKLIRGMPDILISTIQQRPDSTATKLLIANRCFNTVGPRDTRFACMFNGSQICPYDRAELVKIKYEERRIPTFSVVRKTRGKMAHFTGTEVKFTGIKSEAATPYAAFAAYGALNCPDSGKMLINFMHVMADGGPDDMEAPLKCRLLFSVVFPIKDRKRPRDEGNPHPLATFEAVAWRVLEQIMHTGMTSKGGIRPILTMEGHPFHAAECYTERVYRGDEVYGISLKWKGLSMKGPICLPSPQSVSFGAIIRCVVEANVEVIDRPLSELMLKYIHGRGTADFGAEPDRLPIEAVLALELIRNQFARTLEVIKKHDIEEKVEDWATGDLKDFIHYIKGLYKPGGIYQYNFEEFLAHSLEGCAAQCEIYFEQAAEWPLTHSNPNLIVVPGM